MNLRHSARGGRLPSLLAKALWALSALGLWVPAVLAQGYMGTSHSGAACLPANGSADGNFRRGPAGIANVSTVDQFVACSLPVTYSRSNVRVTVNLHGDAGMSAQCQVVWTGTLPGMAAPGYSAWTSPLVTFTATTRVQRISYYRETILLVPPNQSGLLWCRLGRSVRLVSYHFQGYVGSP